MSTSTNQYAIFRIKKLRTPEEISRVGNHNDRKGELPANVDKSRVLKNRSYVDDDRPLLERVMGKLQGVKYRKDAVKAVEIVCGFSAGCEKFIPLDKWVESSLKFIREEFGSGNLVSAVLHLDEKTPHLQCVIIPMVDKSLAAKRLFGTRQQMRDLQSRYHQAVEKFGLVRGTKGSKRPHLGMAEIYQGTQEGRDILERALDSIPERGLSRLTNYKEKVRGHLASALEPLVTAKTEATLHGLEAESLRRIASQAALDRKAVTDRLRSLDLAEVAERILCYRGVKDGKSMVFADDARQLVITGSAFKDQKSAARGERGAISLTRHILDVDFETAVRTLAQLFPEDSAAVEAEAVREVESDIKVSVKLSAGMPLDPQERIKQFATPDPEKLPAVVEYLVKQRGIPESVINTLIRESRVWANRWGSVCFCRKSEDGRSKGVTILQRSTGQEQTLGSSNAVFHFGDFDSGQTVAVTDSPIEALSYHAKTGRSVVAADPSSPVKAVIKFLQSVMTKVLVAVHRGDDAGQGMAEQIILEAEKSGIKSIREKPPRNLSWSQILLNPSPVLEPVKPKNKKVKTPEKPGPTKN